MKWRAISAALALLASVTWAQTSSASTIVLFDNFDSAAQTLNWPGDSVFTSIPVPGNVNGLPSVDLIGAGGPYDFYPGNGNYVDLSGTTGDGIDPAGQLFSNSTFGAGSYIVSFLLGGNARGAADQTTEIRLGGDLIATITLASGDPLALYSYNFVTAGGKLMFTEFGPSDQQGNILDNVVLSAAPELSTWAMMLLGFAGIGFMAYRRSQKASVVNA